jgi:hypothetical protein
LEIPYPFILFLSTIVLLGRVFPIVILLIIIPFLIFSVLFLPVTVLSVLFLSIAALPVVVLPIAVLLAVVLVILVLFLVSYALVILLLFVSSLKSEVALGESFSRTSEGHIGGRTWICRREGRNARSGQGRDSHNSAVVHLGRSRVSNIVQPVQKERNRKMCRIAECLRL